MTRSRLPQPSPAALSARELRMNKQLFTRPRPRASRSPAAPEDVIRGPSLPTGRADAVRSAGGGIAQRAVSQMGAAVGIRVHRRAHAVDAFDPLLGQHL